MTVDDETFEGTFTAIEEGRLVATAVAADLLGVSVRHLRPLLHGLLPTATRPRGNRAPPERYWDLAALRPLAEVLPRRRSKR